ncbi:MAG: hypothetical protein HGA67_01120 [Candidatus Yonathbacteria bacterium]|nr:hypothetical protein [Candidatus Yonathbacteria bacterium]
MSKDSNTGGKERKTLVLLDAHAIIHRAYHALPEFSTAAGEPTGGLYGVSTMLMNIVKELRPNYIVACYDLPEPTFRHDAYDGYKAGRAKADDALVSQIIRSRDIFAAFGIPVYEAPGFEADDLLGTIAAQVKERYEDVDVIIASGDMDTLQLVDDARVRVYTLRKGMNDTIMYDETAVRERFGFTPTLLPDYKGLRGDPSDNIIGITGIGEKTATTLIAQFGSIEEIYTTLKEKGEKPFLDAGLSPRVVGLVRDGEEEAVFSKTLATIRRDAPVSFILPEKMWREALEHTLVENLFTELEFRSLITRFRTLVEDGDLVSTGGSDSDTLADVSVPDPRDLRETAIALWLISSDMTGPTLDDILTYAGTKNFDTARAKIFRDLEEEGLMSVYRDIELPIIPIIDKAQQYGMLIDKGFLKELSVKYHERLDGLAADIYAEAGREFNVNSPKQLGEVLFDEMGLTTKGLKKTAGGARSTRESELEKLRGEHIIIEKILAYRELQKLLSTYIDTLPEIADADGRVHTTLDQAGTTTGRFSSSAPNLQNIPTQGDGIIVRDAFIAPPRSVLLAFDYSQIEMRILAVLSEDETLIDAFVRGHDIHASVAAKVFGVPEHEVTKDMRRKAKVINFGIVYGMGVNALRANLGGTFAEARMFYDGYFERFPKVGVYFDTVKASAARDGYTMTLFGRKRHFADLRSHIPYIKASAERAAMNAPIQGTAADIIKIAMKRVHDAILAEERDDDIKLLLQVHDELVFEVKEGSEENAVRVVRHAMETAADLPVPLMVNVSKGKRWGSMERISTS